MRIRAELTEFSSALVNLANALDEWKNTGADSLTVCAAIRDFIEAQQAERACLARIQDILDDPSERNIHEDIQEVLDS